MKALLPWPSDTVNHTIDRVVKVHQEDWDGITDKVSEQQIDNKSKNRPQQPSPAPNDEAILVLLSILQKWKPLHIWKHLMRGEALGETLEKQNKCSIMIILYIVFNIKLRTSHTQTMHIILSMVDPIISQNWEMKKKAEQWQQLNGKTASHVYGLIHIPGVSQLAVPSTSEEHRHLYWDKASKPQRVTNQRYSREQTKTFQTPGVLEIKFRKRDAIYTNHLRRRQQQAVSCHRPEWYSLYIIVLNPHVSGNS